VIEQIYFFDNGGEVKKVKDIGMFFLLDWYVYPSFLGFLLPSKT